MISLRILGRCRVLRGPPCFFGLALWLCSVLAAPARSQDPANCPCSFPPCDPSLCGSWSSLYDWSGVLNPNSCLPGTPFQEVSHAALIPVGPHTGKVVHWRQPFTPGFCTPTTDTVSWLFNPANPGQIEQIVQVLAGTDVFCSAMAWDRNARLTVAGGFASAAGGVPRETFRLDPRLLRAVQAGNPPTVPGNAWLTDPAFLMSIARYYAGLAPLDRRGITSNCYGTQVPGGSLFVFGGPPTITGEGNELWQFLDPMTAPGAAAWLQTLQVTPGTFTGQHPLPPGVATEDFTLSSSLQAIPSDSLLDSYPRGMQLGDPAPPGAPQAGRVFVAFDVDTVPGGSVPNAPGNSYVMKTPLAMASTSGCWELDRGGSSNLPVTGVGVGDRFYAPVVIMHMIGGINRVLALGGSGPNPAGGPWLVHGNVQEYQILTVAETGLWMNKTPLLLARVFHNAVILPIGLILILGGDNIDVHHGAQYLNCCSAVYLPELYDPGATIASSGASYPMACDPQKVPRRYHSVAVLLLDGSVLVMGGRQRPGCPPSEHTGQVYFPPYFHNGTQPVIDSAPGAIAFNGSSFTVQATLFHQRVHRVVLLRPGSVTHHFDSTQRYIELSFTHDSYAPDPGGVQVKLTVTPPDETLGAPGPYTLWVVESTTNSMTPAYNELIPSQARIIQID